MRLQVLSDVHWDTNPAFRPQPLPGADLLVLAGDLASRHFGSGQYGLEHVAPARGWPTPAVYVPGNHEYDDSDFEETNTRLRALCEELGIIWLDGRSEIIQGVRFIGSTLWADFDAFVLPEDDAMATRHKRRQAMYHANRYLPRMGIRQRGHPFLARQVRQQALLAHQWMTRALATPFVGPTVVVSHFAPSLRSADPRYGHVPSTAGFCNRWDHFLPQADLWLHGHVHCRLDYQHEGCRIVANPVGYPTLAERGAYNPSLLVTVRQRHERAAARQPAR